MAPETLSSTRQLPTRHNPLMTEDVPAYTDLVSRRRLGQTELTKPLVKSPSSKSDAKLDAATDGEKVFFDYAHLRAPLPKGIVSGIFKSSPSSYFLMRRSQDGYVSATGMFKATFPYATAEEEELERHYIKSLPTTSDQETAGNLWIPPEQALTLAVEYHILPWIQALLDPTEIPVSSGGDASPAKKITAPPVFFSGQPTLAPPTPSSMRTTRSRRSVSPTKSASTRRSTTSPRKRSARITASQTTAARSSAEPVSNGLRSASPTLVNGETPILAPPVGLNGANVVEADVDHVKVETIEKEREVVLAPVEEEATLKVHVDQDTKVDEETGEEVTHTTVELELPLAGTPPSAEEAARMVAEAKEMVKAAAEGLAASPATKTAPEGHKNKRKADDIETDDADEANPTDTALTKQPRAKKVRTEVDVKKERIKRRTLFGISATIAVGAIIPYVLGAL
jgi:hypothetical protein